MGISKKNKALVTTFFTLLIVILAISCNNIYNENFEYEWNAKHGGWEVKGISQDNLDEVTIPDDYLGNKVIGIKAHAFENSNFKKINFGNNIKFIGDSAFKYSSVGGAIDFKNVESIGAHAFFRTNVKQFTIHSTTLNVGSKAIVPKSIDKNITEIIVHAVESSVRSKTPDTLDIDYNYEMDWYDNINREKIIFTEGLELIGFSLNLDSTTIVKGTPQKLNIVTNPTTFNLSDAQIEVSGYSDILNYDESTSLFSFNSVGTKTIKVEITTNSDDKFTQEINVSAAYLDKPKDYKITIPTNIITGAKEPIIIQKDLNVDPNTEIECKILASSSDNVANINEGREIVALGKGTIEVQVKYGSVIKTSNVSVGYAAPTILVDEIPSVSTLAVGKEHSFKFKVDENSNPDTVLQVELLDDQNIMYSSYSYNVISRQRDGSSTTFVISFNKNLINDTRKYKIRAYANVGGTTYYVSDATNYSINYQPTTAIEFTGPTDLVMANDNTYSIKVLPNAIYTEPIEVIAKDIAPEDIIINKVSDTEVIVNCLSACSGKLQAKNSSNSSVEIPITAIEKYPLEIVVEDEILQDDETSTVKQLQLRSIGSPSLVFKNNDVVYSLDTSTSGVSITNTGILTIGNSFKEKEATIQIRATIDNNMTKTCIKQVKIKSPEIDHFVVNGVDTLEFGGQGRSFSFRCVPSNAYVDLGVVTWNLTDAPALRKEIVSTNRINIFAQSYSSEEQLVKVLYDGNLIGASSKTVNVKYQEATNFVISGESVIIKNKDYIYSAIVNPVGYSAPITWHLNDTGNQNVELTPQDDGSVKLKCTASGSVIKLYAKSGTKESGIFEIDTVEKYPLKLNISGLVGDTITQSANNVVSEYTLSVESLGEPKPTSLSGIQFKLINNTNSAISITGNKLSVGKAFDKEEESIEIQAIDEDDCCLSINKTIKVRSPKLVALSICNTPGELTIGETTEIYEYYVSPVNAYVDKALIEWRISDSLIKNVNVDKVLTLSSNVYATNQYIKLVYNNAVQDTKDINLSYQKATSIEISGEKHLMKGIAQTYKVDSILPNSEFTAPITWHIYDNGGEVNDTLKNGNLELSYLNNGAVQVQAKSGSKYSNIITVNSHDRYAMKIDGVATKFVQGDSGDTIIPLTLSTNSIDNLPPSFNQSDIVYSLVDDFDEISISGNNLVIGSDFNYKNYQTIEIKAEHNSNPLIKATKIVKVKSPAVASISIDKGSEPLYYSDGSKIIVVKPKYYPENAYVDMYKLNWYITNPTVSSIEYVVDSSRNAILKARAPSGTPHTLTLKYDLDGVADASEIFTVEYQETSSLVVDKPKLTMYKDITIKNVSLVAQNEYCKAPTLVSADEAKVSVDWLSTNRDTTNHTITSVYKVTIKGALPEVGVKLTATSGEMTKEIVVTQIDDIFTDKQNSKPNPRHGTISNNLGINSYNKASASFDLGSALPTKVNEKITVNVWVREIGLKPGEVRKIASFGDYSLVVKRIDESTGVIGFSTSRNAADVYGVKFYPTWKRNIVLWGLWDLGDAGVCWHKEFHNIIAVFNNYPSDYTGDRLAGNKIYIDGTEYTFNYSGGTTDHSKANFASANNKLTLGSTPDTNGNYVRELLAKVGLVTVHYGETNAAEATKIFSLGENY